jgi:CheY-like chemotaxis protein
MKIFICEHDPYRAKLIQDILGVYNYKLVTVNEHNNFLEKAHKQRPAVIVMDSQFAQTPQQDIMEKLRSNPVTSKIPVVYIDSDNQIGTDGTASFDELTAVVSEPLKIKNLRHYIDRWTTLRSLYIKH